MIERFGPSDRETLKQCGGELVGFVWFRTSFSSKPPTPYSMRTNPLCLVPNFSHLSGSELLVKKNISSHPVWFRFPEYLVPNYCVWFRTSSCLVPIFFFLNQRLSFGNSV